MDVIKLIRDIRMCHTPALGGHVYYCEDCFTSHYMYHSCGNGHCPLCQGSKRKKWKESINKNLFKVPYTHITFTMPHELNGLAKGNSRQVYDLLFKSVWQTIQEMFADKKNVGAKPGMVSVLHTWGSDMKYHVHIHCLVTFGGMTKDGRWAKPKREKTIASYDEISNSYRTIFLSKLKKSYESKSIVFRNDYSYYESLLKIKKWVVNQQPPQIDTEIIEEYLSRYICRSAVSPSRLNYVKSDKKVELIFKDYAKQKTGKAAPLATRKIDPLVAINMILQHKLPPYYHRCRYFGLHATCHRNKLASIISRSLIRRTDWVKQLFQLLTNLFNLTKREVKYCPKCGSIELVKSIVLSDRRWLENNVRNYGKTRGNNKDPTNRGKNIKQLRA